MDTLRGTGVALITPFTVDGQIDYDALKKLIMYVTKGGVDYLVLTGTTAEVPTLSFDEKHEVIQYIVENNEGNLPLVLGIGGNNTQEVISAIQNIDLSPFEAILSVSPAYNKPTQEGIYQHYKALAASTHKPIILYNVPSRTGANITATTTLRLARDITNIVGIKEAAGDLNQAMKIIKDKPNNFCVISGDDALALPMTLAGGIGVISVIGQGLPQLFSDAIRLGLDEKATEAYQKHYACLNMIDLIFEEGNPVGIKELLVQQGVIYTNSVRLPLVSASLELQQKIKLELNKVWQTV